MGKKCGSFHECSDTPWGPTSFPFSGLPANLARQEKYRCLQLTIRLPVVPKLRINGAESPLSHKPSWHGQGNLYLYLPSVIIQISYRNLFFISSNILLLRPLCSQMHTFASIMDFSQLTLFFNPLSGLLF